MTTEAAPAPAPTRATQGTAVETPILDGIIEGMAWLVLGLAPLLINVYNVDAYRTIQATFSAIFIVIMVAAWSISVTLLGRWGEVRRMPFVVPLAAFAVIGLGFLFTSPSVPLSGTSWILYLLYCGYFFVLSDMGARKPGFIWRLCIPLFFAFAFNCATGLMQHKGFEFLGQDSRGYTGLYQSWPIQNSGMANYFAGLQAPSRLTSAAGTLGNQNVLGGYLAATIPLFAVLPVIVMVAWRNLVDGLLRRFKTMSESLASVLVGVLAVVLGLNAVVAFAALLATDTRGAWLAVAASVVVGAMVVPAFFREQLSRLSRSTWIALALGGTVGLAAMGGLAYSAGVTPDMLKQKVMSTWTIKQRFVAWEVAAKMATDKPLVGHGIGTYKIKYFSYLAALYQQKGEPIPTYMHHRYVQAHNDFVQLAGEMGFVGLVAGITVLVLFWIAIPRYIWRRRPPPTEGLLLMAALLGTFGMSVFAVSGFPFHIAASSAAWTTIAAMAGAHLWAERRRTVLAAQEATAAAAGPQWGGLPLEARWALTGAISVFAVAMMAVIYFPFRADELTKDGMERYKNGQVVDAGKVLQQAIQLDPERGDARLVMGIVLAMLNKFPEAEQQLVRSQSSYDDVTLHYYLGRVYEAMAKPDEARREYHRALSYFPEGTEVRNVVQERLAVMDGKPTGSAAPAAASGSPAASK